MESLYNNDYDRYDQTRPRVVVFPAPPPTTNALSPAERTRLLRSSKKIARVLGATPHFIDYGVENIRGNDDMLVRQSKYRASVDSIDSVSSCSTTFTSASYSSTSTSATSVSSSHSLNRGRKPPPLMPLQDAWPTRKPLKLKLALEASLESIPASPLTPTLIPGPVPQPKGIAMNTTRHRRSAPLDGSPSSSPCRGVTPEPSSPGSSPPSPSLVIPSRSATRRRKLDRLRRTLGEDVPIRLILSQTAESDSESESEPSLSSCGKTSSEDDLTTPNASPLSRPSPLIAIEIPQLEDNPIPRPLRTLSRKKKITNTRDSLTLPSLKSPRSIRTIKVPQATRPAPPPPTSSSSPNKKASPKAALQHKKPQTPSRNAIGLELTSSPRVYEHPPIVHRRSHSGSSASVGLGLGVILEEKGESEWYGSDDEDDNGFDFIKGDEVLGAVCGWGSENLLVYGGPVGKGMGRKLARSYGNADHARM